MVVGIHSYSTATKVAEYSIRDHFGMMKKIIEKTSEVEVVQ